MSKLIYREPNGNWGVKGISWAEIPDGLYGALYKLHDYEATGLSPDQVQIIANEAEAEWTLVDEAHNVWTCGHCGALHRFEADGPGENSFEFCPYCGNFIVWSVNEEDDDEPA